MTMVECSRSWLEKRVSMTLKCRCEKSGRKCPTQRSNISFCNTLRLILAWGYQLLQGGSCPREGVILRVLGRCFDQVPSWFGSEKVWDQSNFFMYFADKRLEGSHFDTEIAEDRWDWFPLERDLEISQLLEDQVDWVGYTLQNPIHTNCFKMFWLMFCIFYVMII